MTIKTYSRPTERLLRPSGRESGSPVLNGLRSLRLTGSDLDGGGVSGGAAAGAGCAFSAEGGGFGILTVGGLVGEVLLRVLLSLGGCDGSDSLIISGKYYITFKRLVKYKPLPCRDRVGVKYTRKSIYSSGFSDV